ncbi:VacJ family lipoprotein [Undibacterium sp. FT137W]|uniref:VacJ family lipoprotein n=1 Tax=Undibacterium fentianense TaxID=2828728 RepID=A0A941E1T9_9BURK|nr:VacJ family lipoprotein [Undibacterium fentianense]
MKTKALATLEKVSETTGIGNNPDDPLEGFNRSMFSFNESLDESVLKPSAKAYQAVTPDFVQTAVANFFSNIGDAWTAVNNVLQGNVGDGVNDILRFGINTTMGLGGLIDVASAGGMPKHRADFGQTLGVWGVPAGPYVVLPILGASTLRDTVATPVDLKGDLLRSQSTTAVNNSATVLKVLDKRAAALDAVSLIDEAALDKYVFIRGAYLQRRESQISAGKKEDQE